MFRSMRLHVTDPSDVYQVCGVHLNRSIFDDDDDDYVDVDDDDDDGEDDDHYSLFIVNSWSIGGFWGWLSSASLSWF